MPKPKRDNKIALGYYQESPDSPKQIIIADSGLEEPSEPYGLRKNPNRPCPDPDTNCQSCPVVKCGFNISSRDLSGD